MIRDDEVEVLDLMKRYVDGLYHADSATLRDVFDDRLSYVNATPGSPEQMGLDDYMRRVEARTPPASRGEVRDEEIQRIVLKDGQMGVVEARMTMLGRDYQDLLTVIRTEDGWKIVAKVFSYVELEA